MYIEPWIVNLLWAFCFTGCGILIGFYKNRNDHEQIVETTLDYLVDHGYVLTKSGPDGVELVKLVEKK